MRVRRMCAGIGAASVLFLLLQCLAQFGAANAAGRPPAAATAKTAEKALDSRLPEVHLDGTYFTRNGKRFIPMGAHWVPARAAMQWPVQWDPKDIEADFAKMHELGYSIVRLDMMWAWFEPRPGDYNPQAFEQLDSLLLLAHKYQIYLHPSLFIGGEVGEAYWDVPWRHGRHPHADPDMLRLETNLAAEFGRHYAKESAIIGWDLTDEPPFWIVGGGATSDAAAINWTRLIVDGIRQYDKLHPIVVGTSGEEISHGPFRADAISKFVDFFSVHPFTLYAPELFPDALLSVRGTYGAAFEIALSQGAGRPVMIHEMGASSAQFSPERIAAYDRAQIYSGIGAGSIGVDLWCYTDASPEQFHKVPYLRTPQETGWGMTTWDRQDKPLAREFKKISQVVSRLDLTGIAAAAADVGIVIPDEWAKPHGDFSHFGLTGPEVTPYVSTADEVAGHAQPDVSSANRWLMGSALTSFILARRAHLKADFPREYDDWAKRPMLFMPSPITSTADPFLAHVHSDFYEKAKQYVENGGFLYASMASDGAIPEMASLFGARLVDRVPSSEVTLKITAAFGDLKPGDTFHYSVPTQSIESWGTILELTTGKIIAVDQDGRPALVTNEVGRGKTLLSAYPLEHYLANVPAVFDQPENTHRIYEAFRDWVGIKPAFSADQASVEISSLTGDHRGYVVLVNHAAKPQSFTVFTTTGARSISRIGPEGLKPIQLDGSSWKMELDSYEGSIVQWTQ